MSRVKQVRDDVTAAVGALAAVTGRGITPAAVWLPPSRERADMSAAEIMVAPASRQVELIGRGNANETYKVQIAIYEPLEGVADDDTKAEANQTLAEAIIDGLLGERFTTGSKAICYRAGQPLLQSVEHWREKRLWTSFVELDLRNY